MNTRSIIHANARPGCAYLIILDSPNLDSQKYAEHLTGMNLRVVQSAFDAHGVGHTHLGYTFAVPASEEKIGVVEVKQWAEHLEKTILEIKPQKILACGKFAYAILIDKIHLTGARMQPYKNIRGAMTMVKLGDLEIPLVATVPPHANFQHENAWFRDFLKDVHKIVTQDTPLLEPYVSMNIISSVSELQKALNSMRNASFISVDIEASGLNPLVDQIESIGFGAFTRSGTVQAAIIPYELLNTADADTYDRMKELLYKFLTGKRYSGKILYHNAKFDIKMLAQFLDRPLFNSNVRDTLLLNYVLDERPVNHMTAPHGLKRLSREHFDAIDYTFDFKVFWQLPPRERDWGPLHTYLGLDLAYTLKLYVKLIDKLHMDQPESIELYEVFFTRALQALAEVERHGVKIAVDYLKEYEVQVAMELDHARDAMRELAQEFSIENADTLNPNSPKQLAKIIYDELQLPVVNRRKKRSTAAETLDLLQHKYGLIPKYRKQLFFIEQLIVHRKLKKLVSTYVKPLQEKAVAFHISPQFNLAGTGTGRLSSEKPNMQNIPQMAGPYIRRAFIPPDHFGWLKLDYSQLELRIAAHYSNDQTMIQAFKDGRDIHSEVAAAMFGVAPDQVTKKQRYAAKFVDFGILYGRGAQSIATGKELREFNWTKFDAQKFINNYLDEFSVLRDWMIQIRQQAITEQRLTTPMGRVRRWPLITSQIHNRIERQALNFPIQSLASDITVTALIQIQQFLLDINSEARIVLTVHDEIDLICPWFDINTLVPQLIKIMESGFPLPLNVPLVAEAEVGLNWADLSEWTSAWEPISLGINPF